MAQRSRLNIKLWRKRETTTQVTLTHKNYAAYLRQRGE